MVIAKTTFRDLVAAKPDISDAELLNAGNPSKQPPIETDVTVVGAGIHGLVYSITTALRKPEEPVKIAVFEKASRPQYKIGESTLPYFGAWCNMVGLLPEYMLRLFTLHDGLEFYILDRENQPQYADFCSTGPFPFLNIAYQLQRAMSELLLTVFAQRKGIDVWHGHGADVDNTILSANGDVIPLMNKGTNERVVNKTPLLVDATGRFRRFASKAARVKRFEDVNQDAFWAYWTTEREDEIQTLLRGFEAGHTNHVCFPEGWMYLIRMVSWDGSPLANLVDMLNYLLDHVDAKTQHDQVPSMDELAKMFGLTYRYIWSIGYAIRSDTKYPDDLLQYGTNEAQRRFNFITSKYQKLGEIMALFTRLDDHYDSDFAKWHIRKRLNYQSTVVSGPGWVTIGDGIGFTNPLLSPGINAGMGSDAFAAELTRAHLSAKNEDERRALWKPYNSFAEKAVPSLSLMNQFLYATFLNPELSARVGFPWNPWAGHAKDDWSIAYVGFNTTIDTYWQYASNWLWGSSEHNYTRIAQKTVNLLGSQVWDFEKTPPQEVVDEIITFAEDILQKAIAKGSYKRFPFRYDGWFRNFDADCRWDPVNQAKTDVITAQCHYCQTWYPRRADFRICGACGISRPESDTIVVWDPPFTPDEIVGFGYATSNWEAMNPDHQALLAEYHAGKSSVEVVAEFHQSMAKMEQEKKQVLETQQKMDVISSEESSRVLSKHLISVS